MINFLINKLFFFFRYINFYFLKIYKKVLFIFFFIFILRFGYFINIPFLNNISNTKKFSFLNIFNILSAGSINNYSIFSLGITPYVTSYYLIQFLYIIFLKHNKKDNNNFVYLLYFLFNIIQSIFFINFNYKNFLFKNKIDYFISLFSIILGSNILLWLSNQINIYGIGSGNSFIILISVINNIIPNIISIFNFFKVINFINVIKLIFCFLILLILLYIIIFIELSYIKIFVNFPKRYYGVNINNDFDTYIPIKINISGINSYIFSYNLFYIIKYIFIFLNKIFNSPFFLKIVFFLNENNIFFKIFNFIFIFIFSYINTLVLYNVKEISDNLKKSGSFINGIKPGLYTENYINNIIKNVIILNSFYLNLIYFMLEFLNNIINVKIDLSYFFIVLLIIIEFILQIKYYFLSYKYDIILKKMNLK
ncbi:hypothetical protein [Candidatus Nardonella dryophthoridicola]|uniref:Protein translocase subunit SecY n=1 Tax=endosymbiont of Rhynchophorus ferrugineus TaxID=1972133 RepID=A0A2Z5T3Y7_9GAMM|nr:hypothetical protein [Candidatus Nardonella dryophthoridicola]BBA85110.1 protein translocase subunit SecY [endosymbiont of Rhynchophorus ferrugineus]